MNIVILDADTLGKDLSYEALEAFGNVLSYPKTTPETERERIAEADVLIVNKYRIREETLTGSERLRLVCVAATGYDNIDLQACRKRGIAVCNVVGYSTGCVAQLTVGMALSLINHLPEYTEHVRSGEYARQGSANCLFPTYHEISEKTWGIVGFGNIGTAVGKVAQALGCRVLVCKRTPIAEWDCTDLETVCRESDILSLHVPLNAETRGMLDRAHIAMLKPNAIVLNVARGAVADEEALAEAIEENRIGGLGADVYSKEPFGTDHPFWRIRNRPNVCLTPHMAWGGYETRVRLLSEIAKNIEAFHNGTKRNRVDA